MDEEEHHGVIFPKAVSFIWGLILVHSWVECALVALLITHLAHILDLPEAASLVNLLDGTTAVMMLIVPYLSQTHLGPFPTILCTTTAYIFGLLLFYHGAETTQLRYAAVILVGLGRAGCEIQLKEFLSDQCRAEAAGEDEERVETWRKIWWWSFYILGIVASVFLFTKAEWKKLCMILIIAMAVAFVLFLLGFSFYDRKKPANPTLTNIMPLLYTTITNRRRRRHPLVDQRANIQTLRWLDRSAMEESSPGGGREWTVEQVEEVKISLLTMLPLCSMFIVYGLMLATANTFFYEQTDYTANYLGPISPFSYQQSCNDPTLHISNQVPPIIFVIIRHSVLFAVSWLCDFLSRQRWGDNIPGRVMLIRSGVGLAVSSVCCIVAWRVEEHRVQQRLSHGVCIRFSWLIAQFVLLGVMEGLVPQTVGRYGPAVKQFAHGVGHFVSLFFVFIFRNLFKDDLNSSRLGVYYKIISCVCGVNFLIYCCVATYYVKQESSDDGGGGGDEVIEQPLEQIHEQGHESVGVVAWLVVVTSVDGLFWPK